MARVTKKNTFSLPVEGGGRIFVGTFPLISFFFEFRIAFLASQ
jgi:hypothetical protein